MFTNSVIYAAAAPFLCVWITAHLRITAAYTCKKCNFYASCSWKFVAIKVVERSLKKMPSFTQMAFYGKLELHYIDLWSTSDQNFPKCTQRTISIGFTLQSCLVVWRFLSFGTRRGLPKIEEKEGLLVSLWIYECVRSRGIWQKATSIK